MAKEEALKAEERMKKMEAVSTTSKLALKDGKSDIAAAIKSGAMSPEAYMTYKLKEKELYELSRGEMLTDKEGNVIRVNPYATGEEGGRYEHSVAEFKSWDDSMKISSEAEARSNKYLGTIDKLKSVDMTAGFAGTAEEFILRQLGMRDEPNYLRTEVIGFKNHEAIKQLPPGVASDRDIDIVMRGVPPNNASNEEMIRWLQGAAAAQKTIAEFEEMKGQYVITGRAAEFQRDWGEKMEREAYASKVRNTPTEHIEALKANPQYRDDFIEKYGWDPLANG
jgi:hypothetical protein